MPRRTGLRQRISLWLVGYAALLSLAVFVHGYIVNDQAEQLTWRSLLSSELEHFLARSAVDNAPGGASRQSLIDGIGRGIGRAAAHEFAHQILGPAMQDDRTDLNSYEYFSSDRQAQFYGELRWISARPLLQKRLGG